MKETKKREEYENTADDEHDDLWNHVLKEAQENGYDINFKVSKRLKFPEFPSSDVERLLGTHSKFFGSGRSDLEWTKYAGEILLLVKEVEILSDVWCDTIFGDVVAWSKVHALTLSGLGIGDQKNLVDACDEPHAFCPECLSFDPYDVIPGSEKGSSRVTNRGKHYCCYAWIKYGACFRALYYELCQYVLAGSYTVNFKKLVKMEERGSLKKGDYAAETVVSLRDLFVPEINKLRFLCRATRYFPYQKESFAYWYSEEKKVLEYAFSEEFDLLGGSLFGGGASMTTTTAVKNSRKKSKKDASSRDRLRSLDVVKSFRKASMTELDEILAQTLKYFNSRYGAAAYDKFLNLLLDRMGVFFLGPMSSGGVNAGGTKKGVVGKKKSGATIAAMMDSPKYYDYVNEVSLLSRLLESRKFGSCASVGRKKKERRKSATADFLDSRQSNSSPEISSMEEISEEINDDGNDDGDEEGMEEEEEEEKEEEQILSSCEDDYDDVCVTADAAAASSVIARASEDNDSVESDSEAFDAFFQDSERSNNNLIEREVPILSRGDDLLIMTLEEEEEEEEEEKEEREEEEKEEEKKKGDVDGICECDFDVYMQDEEIQSSALKRKELEFKSKQLLPMFDEFKPIDGDVVDAKKELELKRIETDLRRGTIRYGGIMKPAIYTTCDDPKSRSREKPLEGTKISVKTSTDFCASDLIFSGAGETATGGSSDIELESGMKVPNFHYVRKSALLLDQLLFREHLRSKHPKEKTLYFDSAMKEEEQTKSLIRSRDFKENMFLGMVRLFKIWVFSKLRADTSLLKDEASAKYTSSFLTQYEVNWFEYEKSVVERDPSARISKNATVMVKKIRSERECEEMTRFSSLDLPDMFREIRTEEKSRGFADWLRLVMCSAMFSGAIKEFKSPSSSFVLHLDQARMSPSWFQKADFPFLFYSGGRYRLFLNGKVRYRNVVPSSLLEHLKKSKGRSSEGLVWSSDDPEDVSRCKKYLEETLVKEVNKNKRYDDHAYCRSALEDDSDLMVVLKEISRHLHCMGESDNDDNNNNDDDDNYDNSCSDDDDDDGDEDWCLNGASSFLKAGMEEIKRWDDRISSSAPEDGDTLYDTLALWMMFMFEVYPDKAVTRAVRREMVESCDILLDKAEHTLPELNRDVEHIKSMKEMFLEYGKYA